MRAMKCDRCGKLYEHYDGAKRFKGAKQSNAIILIDRDLENKYFSRSSFDLCEDCMRDLQEYLKQGGENCLGQS